MLVIQMVIGTLMIVSTVMIHAVALDRIMVFLEKVKLKRFTKSPMFYKVVVIILAVLGVVLAHMIEIWLWAVIYVNVEDPETFEEAIYFSTSCFTTLGVGDVVLSPEWRFLSTLQSVNGFILFGWSTAFIFEVISKLYENERLRNG